MRNATIQSLHRTTEDPLVSGPIKGMPESTRGVWGRRGGLMREARVVGGGGDFGGNEG